MERIVREGRLYREMRERKEREMFKSVYISR